MGEGRFFLLVSINSATVYTGRQADLTASYPAVIVTATVAVRCGQQYHVVRS